MAAFFNIPIGELTDWNQQGKRCKTLMGEVKTKWKKFGIVFFAVVIAAFFIAAGLSKLIRPEVHTESFVRWGYPAWFVSCVGIVEVAGALMVLFARTRKYGIVLLASMMIGATVTHLLAGETMAVPVPLVVLALVSVFGYMSW